MHSLLAGALGYLLGFASCVGILAFLVRATFKGLSGRYR